MSKEWDALRCLIFGALGWRTIKLRFLTAPVAGPRWWLSFMLEIVELRSGHELDLSNDRNIWLEALLAITDAAMLVLLHYQG